MTVDEKAATGDGSRVRSVARVLASAFAVVVVWFSLTFPDQLGRLTPGAFVRLPVEGVLLVAVALLLPPAWRRATAVAAGLVLGTVVILKVIDVGFFAVLGRAFNPFTDAGYLGSAVGVLRDSTGPARTVAAVVVAVVALVVVLLLVTVSVLRLTALTSRHRMPSVWTSCVLAAVWVLCASLGVQVAGGRVAATVASGFTRAEVDQTLAAPDGFATASGQDLLTGLRGKDVLVVFVESYGRVAVEDPVVRAGVDAVLSRGTASLRSGGLLLAQRVPHVADVRRDQLARPRAPCSPGCGSTTSSATTSCCASDRLTLSGAFKRAGWRTVADVPSNGEDWPEGQAFYGYDTIYDRRNVGYAGPSFSYASMPDQYTLAKFHDAELAAAHHAPVMAEIDLVSSHGPWAPLPRMVDWRAVGDGRVFDPMPAQGQSPADLLGDTEKTKLAYGQSIQYSLSSLVSFVETFHDDNLVVVAVGDHQPAAVVSGPHASRDVPITIIAHDPAVLRRTTPWGWQAGMLPDPQAPVWRMDAFRDRFLTAFGPEQGTPPTPGSPTPR